MLNTAPGYPDTRWKAIATARAAGLDDALEAARCAEERAALEALYASMPLCDLAEHDGRFFADAVRATVTARGSVPWGTSVPASLFRHYVLPLRVNNENLDAFRAACWREIVDKVSALSMRNAVLEINHWCHERAIYRSTDIRTSGPLATIRTGFGRCGEESTLAVSALRAACIPARQVYTPRWAHCDDNHAWVEAWVDGDWHYLGACEPEPDLDLGWFREPARRAMLVHTRVYGPYDGPEPVVSVRGGCSELNVTARYAPVRELAVLVLDGRGSPVEGAVVEFRLYNTGELFPIATRVTGPGGHACMVLGCGDVIVWARKGGAFGYRRVSAADPAVVTVALDADPSCERAFDMDMAPPPEPAPLPAPAGDAARTAKRMEQGDEMRAAAEAGFMGEPAARALAAETGLDGDRVWGLISRSRGNWASVVDTLRAAQGAAREWVLPLLESVAEKDLRDTPSPVFADHLTGALATAGDLASAEPDVFARYVLCPRVDNEILSPYRGPLRVAVPSEQVGAARRDPSRLVIWARRHVALDEAHDARTPLTPAGVLKLRVADAQSLNIFMVALCRSMGLPARLEPARRVPQYRLGGIWVDAAMDDGDPSCVEEGVIVLDGEGVRYGTHYTVSRFDDGRYVPLHFEEGIVLDRISVPAGYYMVVTGSRQADGTVLAHIEFLTVRAGEEREVRLRLRSAEAPEPIESVDLSLGLRIDGRVVTLRHLCAGRGAVVVWAAPGQEPTRHAMVDLAAIRDELDRWGGAVLIASEQGEGLDLDGLPVGAVGADDAEGAVLRAVSEAAGRSLGPALPAIVVMDPDGRLLLLSEGYRVGVGDQIARAIRRAH